MCTENKMKRFVVRADVKNGLAVDFTVDAKDDEVAQKVVADWLNEALIDSVKEVEVVDPKLTKDFLDSVENFLDVLFGETKKNDDEKVGMETIAESMYNSIKESAPQQVFEKMQAHAKAADKAGMHAHKKRKDLTFKDIYDAVKPNMSASEWGPGEKSHIVKIARRKDSSLADIVEAMDVHIPYLDNAGTYAEVAYALGIYE